MNNWGLSQGHKDFLVSTNQSVWFYCCCSVNQSCLALCDPMDCRMPGFPVLHHLLELAQTHVQSQWCHPTVSSSVIPFSACLKSFPASGSFPVSHLFTSGGQNIGASASALVLPNEYLGLISFRIDWFDLLTVQETLKSLLQHHNLKCISSLALSLLYCPALTSIHDYWKNHSLDYRDLC